MRRGSLIATVLVFASLIAAGCGGSDSGGGRATLNLWVFNEPSGSFTDAAKRCSDSSDGRYKIVYNTLSNDADQQRQSLVRRLAAKDSSIDIAGMDVVWTAEFAEANWIKPWPERFAAELRKGTLAGPAEDRDLQGQDLGGAGQHQHAAALVPQGPGQEPGRHVGRPDRRRPRRCPRRGRIEIQGAQYEGTTVWFNSLVASAGGTIVDDEQADAERRRGQRAAAIMQQARHLEGRRPVARARRRRTRTARPSSPATRPSRSTTRSSIRAPRRATRRSSSRSAGSAYPGSSAGKPPSAPIGGINWGVGGYTKHPTEAFEAAACLRNEQNQREAAAKGGLPPTLAKIYADPKFEKDYPVRRPDQAVSRDRRRAPADPGLRGRLAGDLQARLAARRRSQLKRLRRRPAEATAAGRARLEGAVLSDAAVTAASEAARGAAARAALTERARAERKLGWMLCAPAAIVMLAVTAYPIVYAVYLSLLRADLRFPDQNTWVGLDNYITVLGSSLWWTRRSPTRCSSRSSRSPSSSCSACCSRWSCTARSSAAGWSARRR